MGFFRNSQSTTTFLPLSPSSATIDDDREKREKSFAIRLKTRTMSRLQSKLEKNNTRFSKANKTKPKKSNGTESTFPQQSQSKISYQPTKNDVSLSPASTWSLMSFPSPVSASSSFGSSSNMKEKANTSEYFDSPTTPTPLLSLPYLKNTQSPPRTSSIKQEEGVENNLPSDYIETITDVYGRPVSPVSSISSTSSSSHALTVDLYNDVFHIPSDASEEQILEAYLQEGRKVLTEAKILFTPPPSSSSSSSSSGSSNNAESNGMDNTTQIVDYRNNNTIGANIKSKFVATSMAYEILTTPAMAQTYRRQAGLLTPTSTSTTTTMNPPNGNPTPSGSISVLRKSSFRSSSSPSLSPSTESSLDMLRSSSSCSTASIRWKDHVEIKTFTGHPDEHDPSRRRSSVKNGTNSPSKSGDTTTNSMQNPLTLPSRRQGRNHQKNKNATTRASGTNATSIATKDTATGTEIIIPSCDHPTPNVSTKLGSRLFKLDSENDEQFQKDAWDVIEDFMCHSSFVVANTMPCSSS